MALWQGYYFIVGRLCPCSFINCSTLENNACSTRSTSSSDGKTTGKGFKRGLQSLLITACSPGSAKGASCSQSRAGQPNQHGGCPVCAEALASPRTLQLAMGTLEGRRYYKDWDLLFKHIARKKRISQSGHSGYVGRHNSLVWRTLLSFRGCLGTSLVSTHWTKIISKQYQMSGVTGGRNHPGLRTTVLEVQLSVFPFKVNTLAGWRDGGKKECKRILNNSAEAFLEFSSYSWSVHFQTLCSRTRRPEFQGYNLWLSLEFMEF